VDPGQRSEPDGAPKPSTLREISAHSWWYLARRTLHEFLRDDCLDLAAGLTYYAVLAVLPGLIAVISLLGVLGKGPESVATILGLARQVVPASALGILQPVVEGLIQTPRATLALVLGILGALWFVSGYVTAFGRVMNQIYAIGEGRPIWKLQPLMILVTLVLGVLCLCAVLLLLISGPLARALGNVLGLGSTAVLVWTIVRWRVMVAITCMVITLLYYVTPNVRQPRFLAELGRGARNRGVAGGFRPIRPLRRQLLQLRRHVRVAGRRDRLPGLVVAHQHRRPAGRGAERRDRTGPRVAGRRGSGTARPTAGARHAREPEEVSATATGPRRRPRDPPAA